MVVRGLKVLVHGSGGDLVDVHPAVPVNVKRSELGPHVRGEVVQGDGGGGGQAGAPPRGRPGEGGGGSRHGGVLGILGIAVWFGG